MNCCMISYLLEVGTSGTGNGGFEVWRDLKYLNTYLLLFADLKPFPEYSSILLHKPVTGGLVAHVNIRVRVQMRISLKKVVSFDLTTRALGSDSPVS